MAFFEISTTKYEENIKLLQVVMTKMAAVCNVTAGIQVWRTNSAFWLDIFSNVRRSRIVRRNRG